MKREDFSFDSRDQKTRLHAVRWIPEGEPVAVVQIVHGMAEHVERYEDFARFLADNNIVVTAEDHLGHGRSVGSAKGYFCKKDPATVVVKDVHRLKKITQEKYPKLPYYILGHSMGSFILRNYLFTYGKGISGAIVMGTGVMPKILPYALRLLAVCGCIIGHSKRPSNFINSIAFSGYTKKIDNPRTGYDWLTKEETIVDKYIADDLCGFTFPCNGFKTMADLLVRLTRKSNVEKMPVSLRVLITSGEEDPVGDYGNGPKKLYKEYIDEGMQKVSIKLYPGDRHEILNETDKQIVYDDLLQWILDKSQD